MSQPHWLGYLFAILMIGVSASCASRICIAHLSRKRIHNDIEVNHFIMGLSMMGMLVPGWNLVSSGVFVATFSVFAVLFVAFFLKDKFSKRQNSPKNHSLNTSHYPFHILMNVAMIAMYWITDSHSSHTSTAMAMSPASGSHGELGAILLMALIIGAVLQIDLLSQKSLKVRVEVNGSTEESSDFSTADQMWLAPSMGIASNVIMCITMAFMFVLLL